MLILSVFMDIFKIHCIFKYFDGRYIPRYIPYIFRPKQTPKCVRRTHNFVT